MFDKGVILIPFLVIILSFSTLINGCEVSSNDTRLKHIESIIESDPKTAMMELEAMSLDSFQAEKDKALYSILKSMALAKNGTFLKEFDVLQPAIDYYSKKGSATDRLRVGLYEGNVYYNRGDYESAMTCYANALDYAPRNRDLRCLSRIYGTQAVIYRSLFNYDKCIDAAMKAAEIMMEEGDTANYFQELNTIANSYLVLDEKEKAYDYLMLCDSLWQGRSYVGQRDYFRNWIIYSEKFLGSAETAERIDRYLQAIPAEYVYWPAIADAYYRIGDMVKAETALQNYDIYGGVTSAGIEAIRARVLENKGEYREALSHYKQYIELSDVEDLYAYRHNTRAIPELHELDVDRNRQRQGRLNLAYALIAVLIILGLSIVVFFQRMKLHKAEKARLQAEKAGAEEELKVQRLELATLRDEFDHLKEIRDSASIQDSMVKKVLEDRFSLLNRLFLANILEDWDKVDTINAEVRSAVKDRETFTLSLHQAFEISNPSFLNRLRDCGLTDKEIRYCCLFALGLRGDEVGRYMQDSRHYHVSSFIRSKLGLGPHDTNLGLYLQRMANE